MISHSAQKKKDNKTRFYSVLNTINYHLQLLLFIVVHTGANYNAIYIFREKNYLCFNTSYIERQLLLLMNYINLRK